MQSPRPHDLLWGFTPEQLAADAPSWCMTTLAHDLPVVVRRAPPEGARIPVGLRGEERSERLAAWLPLTAIRRTMTPEQLRQRDPEGDVSLPVWRALAIVRGELDALDLAWGVTGSAAFELACGRRVTHAGSDLDLLLRAPQPFSRQDARELCELLTHMPCRVDVQLQTPRGGLALAEWGGTAARVMIKGNYGPLLTADPWEDQI